MSIEFNHCLGASIYGEEFKKDIFEKIGEWGAPKNIFQRIILDVFALPIGIGLSLVTLATKIAVVGEVCFKGFANIGLGLIGIEEFSAKLGVKQLCAALPASIIDLIFGAPVHMAYNIMGDSSGIVLSATALVEYSKDRGEWHERKIEQLEASKFTSSTGMFVEHSNSLPSDPKNFREVISGIHSVIDVITVVGNAFIFGDVLPPAKSEEDI